MKIRTITAAIALAGFFMAADSGQAQAQTAANEAPSQAQSSQTAVEQSVTVAAGDTLSKIASSHQTTYVRLYDANAVVEHPDVIHPGEIIRIPSPEEQLASRPIPGAVAPAPAQPVAAVPAVSYSPPRQSNKPVGTVSMATWDALARCESGGNWAINTGNGYFGGLQFTLSSWKGVGGTGYPHQNSKEEQIYRAERLLASQGWNAWPACARKLDLL